MNWRQLALELADLKLAKTAGESQGQLWCKTIERFSKPSNKGQHRVGGGGGLGTGHSPTVNSRVPFPPLVPVDISTQRAGRKKYQEV